MDLEMLARRMREMRASALRQAVDTRKTTIAQARVVDASEFRREPTRKGQPEPQAR